MGRWLGCLTTNHRRSGFADEQSTKTAQDQCAHRDAPPAHPPRNRPSYLIPAISNRTAFGPPVHVLTGLPAGLEPLLDSSDNLEDCEKLEDHYGSGPASTKQKVSKSAIVVRIRKVLSSVFMASALPCPGLRASQALTAYTASWRTIAHSHPKLGWDGTMQNVLVE